MSTLREKGPIAWMAANPVAANLLMLLVMLAGVQSIFTLKKEVFPTFPTEMIRITVPYPGSSPEEVEEGVLVKIEEAVQDMEGLDEITSQASEGVGVVTVEMKPRSNMAKALNDVTSRVNAIASFPVETEKPIIEEILSRIRVINLSIYGRLTEHQLTALADRTRDELLNLPGITQVDMAGVRDYEISIELSDERLRQYGLSFDDVVNLVRQKSRNLPGGKLRTDSGTITLRSQSQAYTGRDYADLDLITRPDGTRIRLGDIATVRDGFEDQPILSRFNGNRAARLSVYSMGDQNALRISRQVRNYVQEMDAELPQGVHMATWNDNSRILKGRIQLLLKNAAQGGLLVLIFLSLFLRLAMAFWVLIGIPFSFLGTLFVMGLPVTDVSINVVSVFAFLLVLGIVVDDAIVTGESAFTYLEREKDGINSVVRGVRRVSVATVFGVLTTVAAFVPMFLMSSDLGRFSTHIATVVISCLLLSLLETKFILPAHLRHLRIDHADLHRGPYRRLQDAADRGLKSIVANVYRPALEAMLRYRYLTLAGFTALLIVSLSLMPAGIVRFVFFPVIPSDAITVMLKMPASASYETTQRYALRIEEASAAVNRRYREVSGENRDVIESLETLSEDDTSATISAALIPSEDRHISSVTMAGWWREALGELPGVKELSFNANAGPSGANDMDVELEGADLAELQRAAQALREDLASLDGVFDVHDTFGAGAPEVAIHITPQGESMGLGQAELARQVRQAFFGAEIQRFQRGRHEVRVYARLPEAERSSVNTLEDLWVQLPGGEKVPFTAVATASPQSGISAISRVDRRRVVNVQSGIDKARIEPDDVTDRLRTELLPALQERFPGIDYRFAGIVEEQEEDTLALQIGALLVLLMIYSLLAVPLRSYIQPLYIMSAIPFAVVGAFMGHLLMGMAVNMMSTMGIIALAGIVVNDSLVLVDFINQEVEAGADRMQAAVQAGQQRFRAVVLTTATTFLGLLPVQLETAIQAQFVKPMAISVSFGILFATTVTLFLVPVLFYISHDLSDLRQRFLKRTGITATGPGRSVPEGRGSG